MTQCHNVNQNVIPGTLFTNDLFRWIVAVVVLTQLIATYGVLTFNSIHLIHDFEESCNYRKNSV